MTAHSEAVAYYLTQAREAIQAASAEHHKREVPDPPPQPEPDDDPTPTTRVAPVRAQLAARRDEEA